MHDYNDATPDDTGDEQESRFWDSDEALADLKMEQAVHGDESHEQMAMRLLREAAPQAAMSIIYVAMHSANDNTRLAASRYIIDKSTDDGTNGAKQTWEDMVGDVVSSAEMFANSNNKE